MFAVDVPVDVWRVPSHFDNAAVRPIATRGPAQIESIAPLIGVEGSILVEKPLGTIRTALTNWTDFAPQRSSPIYVLHNYRLKSNVLEMLGFLRRYTSGKIHKVSVDFQSPPVTSGCHWRRKERHQRTLLFDYFDHFYDLATMLCRENLTDIFVDSDSMTAMKPILCKEC